MASLHALVAAVTLVGALPAGAQATAVAPAPVKVSRLAETDSAVRVEVVAEDKRVIAASYWAPKDPKGAAPAVLLVHDAGGQRGYLSEIGERLWKQGFAVVALDLRGHGESLGTDKPWSELSEEERSRTWTYALRDVKAVAGWVGKQPAVHSSNLSLLGDRAGCTLVARHAMRDESVRSLVLLDPQVEQYGFDLAKDIAGLAGLPTYIAVTKESQSKAQSLIESGEKANDGNKFIELAVFKGAAVMPVSDKGMIAGITKFFSTQALPKKADKK